MKNSELEFSTLTVSASEFFSNVLIDTLENVNVLGLNIISFKERYKLYEYNPVSNIVYKDTIFGEVIGKITNIHNNRLYYIVSTEINPVLLLESLDKYKTTVQVVLKQNLSNFKFIEQTKLFENG